MKIVPVMLLAILSAACDTIPRDQDGALERIRSEGTFRVGLVSSGAAPARADRLQALLARTAAAAGAVPQITPGASEPLLLQLEEGELDLVLGEFDQHSPWVRRVHLIAPLAQETRAGAAIETTAALRNGENAWTMLVEREARAVTGGQ